MQLVQLMSDTPVWLMHTLIPRDEYETMVMRKMALHEDLAGMNAVREMEQDGWNEHLASQGTILGGLERLGIEILAIIYVKNVPVLIQTNARPVMIQNLCKKAPVLQMYVERVKEFKS